MNRDRTSVLILHNVGPTGPDGRPVWRESDAGVLDQVEAVAGALDVLGLPHRTVGVVRLADVPAVLAAAPEAVVFNLVEGFGTDGMAATLVPALCLTHGKGCTGNDTPGLMTALDKWQTKALLQAAGLSTPAGLMVAPGEKVAASRLPAGPCIVKPAWTDASEGIHASSVVAKAGPALRKAVARVHRDFGHPAIIEQYIEGRELNVSVFERGGVAEMLPIAEIDFSAFPAGCPRIVDYAAKWLPESFEYQNTPRIIPARVTARQAAEVRRLTLAAWHALGCRDYARVDLRMDARGRAFVLEVNPNPDITADAGFASALAAVGIPYEEFVSAMVENARRRTGGKPAKSAAPAGKRGVVSEVKIRRSVQSDRDAVMRLLDDTRFFRPDEVVVAAEILDDVLAKGPEGHYQSFVAEADGQVTGWVCYGPTPCTIGTFDIYWIAVSPHCRGRGIGARLMAYAEGRIAKRGGRLAVVETASRPDYEPTRLFYLKVGYTEAARLPEFYAPGDDKVVYLKRLDAGKS